MINQTGVLNEFVSANNKVKRVWGKANICEVTA